MAKKGKIKISSENMMPIIKKWLYSEYFRNVHSTIYLLELSINNRIFYSLFR